MPENYEKAFWEEIWGCVNYIKLPYDTVMRMPVNERKIWIQRHNLEQQRERERYEKQQGGTETVNGESLNAYARVSQEKIKNGTNF